MDQAEKPIPEAVVQLKSESTGASRSMITDSEGKFTVSDVARRDLFPSEFPRPVSP